MTWFLERSSFGATKGFFASAAVFGFAAGAADPEAATLPPLSAVKCRETASFRWRRPRRSPRPARPARRRPRGPRRESSGAGEEIDGLETAAAAAADAAAGLTPETGAARAFAEAAASTGA